MLNKSWFGYFTVIVTGFMIFWMVAVMGKIGTRINNPSPDAVITDSRLGGYTPAEAYTYLETLGEHGRQVARSVYFYEDLVLPFAYGTALCCLLLYFLSRSFPGNKKILLMGLFPWISVALDFWENYLSVQLIDAYPARLDPLAQLASTITVIKWITAGIIVVMVLVSVFLFFRKKIGGKKAP